MMVKCTIIICVLALFSVSNTTVMGQNSMNTFDDIISNDSDLSSFYTALIQSELNISDAFESPITIFAPNNDAFTDVTSTFTKFSDIQYIAHLQSLLLMHVVQGETLSTDLTDGTPLFASNMELINVSISGGVATLSTADSTATVTDADIVATGGVLHKIDGVLIPSFVNTNLLDLVSIADSFSILLELLELTGLASSIGNNITATVFAPTDAAFNSLPEGGLDYYRTSVAKATKLLLGHVITPQIIPTQNMVEGPLENKTPAGTTLNITILEDPSGDLYLVDDSTISIPNILAENGIIHGISSVLSVPGAEYPPIETTTHTGSFEDIIANDSDLSVMYTALNISGLNLSDAFESPITVFAPDNDAFNSITSILTKFSDKQYIAHLQSLLLLHIIQSEVFSTDLVDGSTIIASNFESINVTLTGGVATLSTENSAGTISEADITSSGGVLHKIDGVLIPSFVGSNLLDLVGNVVGFSILTELLTLTGLSGVIGSDVPATVFAPTDAAFETLPEGALDYYKSNVAITTQLLLGHVITPQIIPTQNMVDGPLPYKPPTGTTLTITILEDPSGNLYLVNNTAIALPNILAENGIIHGISSVLPVPGAEYPPIETTTRTGSFEDIIAKDPDLCIFYIAIVQSGLNLSDAFESLITVFAPDNDAFTNITSIFTKFSDKQYIAHLQNFLLMHVIEKEVYATAFNNGTAYIAANLEYINVTLSGGNVSLSTANSTATITLADVVSTEGVLHKIDGVLIPSFVGTNLLDLAGNADGFSILTELLTLTGLSRVVGSNVTATVFAPTDAAFEALPEGVLDYYKSNAAIATTLLTGHVITPQIIPTQNMVAGPLENKTSAGTTLNITIVETSFGDLYLVNNITIANPNILAANGIIHGISSVLPVPGTEYLPINTTTSPTSPTSVPTPTRPTASTSEPLSAPASVPPPPTPTSSAISVVSLAYTGVVMSTLFSIVFMA